MRFQEKKDCYIDTKTGIKWAKDNKGKLSWCDAIDKAPFEWRLPTIEELLSIIYYKIDDIPTDLPNMFDHFYWSSSIYIQDPNYAWGIHFYSGVVNNYCKTSTQYVRYIKEM